MIIRAKGRTRIGIAEAAVTRTPSATAKMPNSAVFPNQTVIEGLPVAAGLSKLDMVFNFLANGSWILAKLTADAFEGFSFI